MRRSTLCLPAPASKRREDVGSFINSLIASATGRSYEILVVGRICLGLAVGVRFETGILGMLVFSVGPVMVGASTGSGAVLSFVLAGLGCLFAGLCYAEIASMIPIAGSAYTSAYATLGAPREWLAEGYVTPIIAPITGDCALSLNSHR